MFVYEIAVEWLSTGLSAAWMISPRAATPALGTLDVTSLSPPLRNPLSTGPARGPWIQTDAVVNYYAKRSDAMKSMPADLSVADPISADAGLMIVAAAEEAESSSSADIATALEGISFDGIAADYRMSGNQGVDLDGYAVTSYNKQASSQTTYVGLQFPNPSTNGGFFVAIAGTSPLIKSFDLFEGD